MPLNVALPFADVITKASHGMGILSLLINRYESKKKRSWNSLGETDKNKELQICEI
jgi:hypothetical protein